MKISSDDSTARNEMLEYDSSLKILFGKTKEIMFIWIRLS